MIAVGYYLDTVVGAAGCVCRRCVGVAAVIGNIGCTMPTLRFETEQGVRAQGLTGQQIPWITVPASRLLLAPWRNLKVTVPGVVGVHFKVVGLPAVREKPSGTLKGLGFAARATGASTLSTENSETRILIKRRLDARLSLVPGRNWE